MKSRLARTVAVALTVVSLGVLALLGCQSQQAQPPAQSSSSGSAPSGAASAAPTAAPQAPAAAAPTQAPAAVAPTKAPAPTQAPAATQAPAPTAAPETLKIGLMVSLTGPTTRMGTAIERFVKFGIEDVNAKGGFKVGNKTYKFSSVTVDDKGTADGGREAANKLVLNEKVNVIMGAVSTPLAGAQPIAEANKVLVLANSALNRSLGKNFPLTFQIGFIPPEGRLGALYDMLKQDHPRAKRVMLMYPDDPTGRTNAVVAAEMAKERGFTVVGQEFYPLDLKDFEPLVTRVLRTNPDAIDVGPCGGRGPLCLAQLKTLKSLEFKGPTFGMSADLPTLKEGGVAMEGFVAVLLVDHGDPVVLDVDKQMVQRYIKAYSEAELETNPISNSRGPSVLAQIIEKAGTLTDTEKMAQTLREGEWNTLYGKQRLVGAKTFGANVLFETPIYFSGVRDGKVSTFKYLNGTVP